MCDAHWFLWRKHGDPTIKHTAWTALGTTMDRVMARHSVNEVTGCWEWNRRLDAYGYGYLTVDGKVQKAHRVAFALFKEPPPGDMSVDHMCRNHACVNPEHLRLLTRGENADSNRIKTHCPAGHPYDEANTYRNGKGNRICRACNRERYQRSKAADKVSHGYSREKSVA